MRSVKWILATSASLIAWLPGQAVWAQQTDSPVAHAASPATTAQQGLPDAVSASAAATAAATLANTATRPKTATTAVTDTGPSASPSPGATASHDSGQSGSAPPIATTPPPVPSAPTVQTADAANPLGQAVSSTQLDTYRGGSQTFNDMQVNGTLSDTRALGVQTGSNAIADGSFANASGLPTVIQNTGNNVLIQNATIVNVQFKQ